jgi:hypothetical protein
VQGGLRGYMPDVERQKWMDQQGIRSHYMAGVEKDGWDAVMKRALEEALDGPEVLFISLDVDVFDPSFVPGTGTPEANGLTPREVFPLVRRLCAKHQVIRIEVVGCSPISTRPTARPGGIEQCRDCRRVYRLGVVEECVPADRLMEAATAIAADIASKSPLAIRLAKHALNTIEFTNRRIPVRAEHDGRALQVRRLQGGHAGLRREASGRLQGPLSGRSSSVNHVVASEELAW